MTYKEFASECIDDVKNYIVNYFNDGKPKQCSLDGKPVEVVAGLFMLIQSYNIVDITNKTLTKPTLHVKYFV